MFRTPPFDRTRPRVAARVRTTAGHRRTRHVLRIAAHGTVIVLLLSVPTAALADASGPIHLLAANSLPTVVNNLRNWLMGILAAVATLFLVLAGVYWATAGGDTAQVEKAKSALKNALIGYGLAVLAPVLLQVVKGIVGNP